MASCDSGGDYLGSVCFTASNYCPSPTFLPADGRSLQVSANANLFALIGNKFGGDGVTTFNLPNLNGRSAAGVGAVTPRDDNSPNSVSLAQATGGASAAISQAQFPPHTHPASFAGQGGAPVPVAVANAPLTGGQAALSVSASAPLTIGITPRPATGTTNMISSGALLTSSARIPDEWTTSSGATLTDLGPANAVSGTASVPQLSVGPIASTGTVALTTTPQGQVSLGSTGSAQEFSTQSPSLGVTACVDVGGQYPPTPQ